MPDFNRRAQRTTDFTETLQLALEGKQAEMWTAMPAVLTKFDALRRTCEVQPTIQAVVEDEFGKDKWVTLPLLVDLPVQFPGGGGFVLTFPLQPGDEGLVIFASRCIDLWWADGPGPGNVGQRQAELRMHDLSDGFFIPTVRSVPNVEENINVTDVELRSVAPDGPKIALKFDGSIRVVSAGSVSLEAPTINITGTLVINGQPYDEHTHFKDGTGGPVTGVKA